MVTLYHELLMGNGITCFRISNASSNINLFSF
ncbi:hypothetical protein SAMN06265218_109135 [Fodinibius sediminis]|uniref:Uncharacterized protein n=1 Tax=Fodinibius sediminis TaxID=1214077 RepID=A0A521DBM7_9BACT|nr:hypothetical protein SAMN06265218_109135 [Fodinibius sediminis]